MLEWDHLRIVLAIHRRGSMQGAAEDLAMDRATVLRRLDALETRLKAQLFDRRRDGCVLTEAGHRIIATVEGIEQAMTAIEHRVSGRDREAEGVVHVTVPEFFAAKVIVPELPRFARLHPGIEINVSNGHGFLNLVRGEADIALRNRRPEQNTLVARKVGSVAIGFFASTGYLAEAPQRQAHDFVLFDQSLAAMPGATVAAEMVGGARVVMRSNEILPLAVAARVGLGITFMPAIAAHGEPDLHMVPPGIIGLPEIFLVTHRDLRERARVRLVFDFLVHIAGEYAAALSGQQAACRMADRLAGVGFSGVSLPSPSVPLPVLTGP